MTTEIEKEFYKCLNDDNLNLICNDAYIVTKDGSHIDLKHDIISQIKEHIDNFNCISMILAYQPYKESFEDTKKVYIDTKKKIEVLNNFNFQYWDVYYDLDEMTNDDNTGWQFLCSQNISLKNPQTLKEDDKMTKKLKEDDKMTKKLKEEAIDEIVGLLEEVKEVVSLLEDMGVRITSDPWTATSFDSSENILVWKRKDFEKINENISDGDIFYIGGNVITGGEHQYKNKWIIAPKELAEVQGNIFKKYLQSIVNSTSLKYFNLELKNPYGLTDNCGWENWFVIETTVKDSALINNSTEKLLQQILNEEDYVIELSASPIYEKPKNEFPKETGLQPQGDFAYMIEFFSTSLVCQDDGDYIGCFSAHDYNGKYIRDAMALINDVEKRAKELENKYSDKGVKVTVNDFNEGCQYGMAVYVWIPYQ